MAYSEAKLKSSGDRAWRLINMINIYLKFLKHFHYHSTIEIVSCTLPTSTLNNSASCTAYSYIFPVNKLPLDLMYIS
jgi:hypothetical protein